MKFNHNDPELGQLSIKARKREACLGISLVIWVTGDEKWAVKIYIRREIYKKTCYILLTYVVGHFSTLTHNCITISVFLVHQGTPRDTWGVDQESDTALVCCFCC